MKFVPKEIKENVNISKVPVWKEFLKLVIEILGAFLLIYIVLGLVLDYLAPRLSPEMERRISRIFAARFEDRKYPKTEEQIQGILNELVKNASLPRFDYTAHIEDSKEVNAVAFPAGNIIIYSALLKEVESKNELAMVLAHELGHYAHRDHLRGMGRGLVFLVLSSVTLGADSAISKLIGRVLSSTEMRFSQGQEKAADIHALELLYKTYNNAAGATDFYEKMAAKEKIPRIFYMFATHPYIKDRIDLINSLIKEKGYAVGTTTPIDFPELAKEKYENRDTPHLLK